jgi:hypothetical protein
MVCKACLWPEFLHTIDHESNLSKNTMWRINQNRMKVFAGMLLISKISIARCLYDVQTFRDATPMSVAPVKIRRRKQPN